ncbi:MAG: hydantoinase B/oxoprolinase family protein [Alphaproteobacteria bacterium]|nr:hydantoinase B/oxoprolinase family protein [Alphaproteobacteria bacterium]
MAKARLDPLDIGIWWNRLLSIADEGTVTLKRTAFSRNVTEADDFSNAIFDTRGVMIAQPSQGEVAFLGVMSTEVKAFLERFPARTLRPGDVIISNDPWLGASQLNDYTMMTPVFVGRRLAAIVACCAHSPDVGGRVLSSDSTDVHEEGFIIPPSFLYRAGKPNPDLFAFIRANVRVPDIVVGDLMAMVTSNGVVARRLREFLKETGLRNVDALGAEIVARSERAMRAAIAKLPRGTFRGEVEADGDDEPIRIKVALTCDGKRIHADLTGTSAQTARGVNVTMNWTYSDVVHAILCALRPESPINAGSMAPITVFAPKGSVLNAQYPAAVGARVLAAHHLYYAVFRALAHLLPGQVLADSAAPTWVPVLSGTSQNGDRFVEILIVHGGVGARASKDGLFVAFPDHPPSTHVEIFENEKPIVVEAKEFLPDSAGAGRFRGGPGLHFRFRVTGDKPVRIAMRADRVRVAPQGFAGGHAGSVGKATLNDRDAIHPKRTIFLQPGDVVDFKTPGGGGFHDPSGRDPAAVALDLENEMLTPEAARRIYGRNAAVR